MEFTSFVCRNVLAVSFAAVLAASLSAKPCAELNREIQAQEKISKNHRDIVEFLERRRNDADVQTNAKLRVYLDRKIVSLCVMPSWVKFRDWDKKWADGHIGGVCERAIASSDCPPVDKLWFMENLSRHQAGMKDYSSSLATAGKALELPDLKGAQLYKAYCLLADAHRWAERYDAAKSAYEKASFYDPVDGARKLADLAVDFGKDEDIEKAWKRLDDPTHRLLWYCAYNKDRAADDAFKYISDKANPAVKRRDILMRFFGTEKTEMGRRARLLAKEFDYSNYVDFWLYADFTKVYKYGDWEFFASLAETFSSWSFFREPSRYRAYLFSLVATGRAEKAAKLAEEFLKAESANSKSKLTALDRLKFEMLKALAEEKDLIAVAKAAKIDVKDYAMALKTAAQWTLNLQRNEECERYSEAYRSLFKEPVERKYSVRFFERPVSSIAALGKIDDQLEKTYVDVKMCGELDALETDVATGRVAVEKTAADTKNARMEISAFSDPEGLRIVMRVKDPAARAVENGFAGGIATESYFAPGFGQPYVCFSSSPKEGVGYMFYTSYSSLDYRRIDFGKSSSPYALRQETEFSDDGYTMMVTLPWMAFYQRLPDAAGTEWLFECLADGFSWGGSQGVHESSSWGRLVFNLKPSEMAQIRRRIIFDTYKTWNRSAHGELSPFERWADPVVGDPEFYAAVLKPIESRLNALSAKVTPTMTDEEVAEIYENGAKVWIGLKHEIDALRRNWLLDQLTR